jgi:hypothetical protein
MAFVAEWTEEIQTLEARPILTKAIAVARAICLARAEIRYWELELQEIVDRHTLDRAISIYRQGKISLAIGLSLGC